MRWTLAFGLLLCAACASPPHVETDVEPADLALTRVAVIDVESGRVLPDQTVLIAKGRIQILGPSATVFIPAPARVVDASGKYLIPGLIDTHTHLHWALGDPALRGLRAYVAHGITTIRHAGGRDQDALALRSQAARGEVLSPMLYVAGGVHHRNVARHDLPDLRALVRQLVARGVDGLKARDGLSDDDLHMIVEEAAHAGLPVFGHTYDPLNRGLHQDEYTPEAVRLGIAGVMHVSGIPQLGPAAAHPSPPTGPRDGEEWQAWWLYDAARWLRTDPAAEQRLIEMMIARDTWLEPTLLTEDWITSAERYQNEWDERGLPGSYETAQANFGWPRYEGAELEQYQAALGRMQSFVRRFHEAGGVVVAGTDCFPACGWGLQDELRLLVEAGLSPLAALQAGTINAAQVLRWEDRIGTVEEGKRADLVLLDADPLENIGNAQKIRGVVLGGRYLDRQALDELLEQAKQATDP